MSSYGSTSAVVVQPWIASQEFRDALHTVRPTDAQLADCPREPAPLDGVSTGGLVSSTAQGGSTIHAARAQRLVVAHAAAGSLADLGFHVRPDDGVTSTIWAERGHQIMAMEIHDGGGFEYDLAGLEGSECGEVLEQFHAGMASRGVTYRPIESRHNDPRGGQLIRRVLRHRRPAPPSRQTSTGRAAARPT